MKKFLLFFMVTLFVISIYLLNKDNKELIFKVGDSLSISRNINNIKSYDNYFQDHLNNKLEDYILYGYDNYRIGELIRDIKDNIKINNKTIQNILIKSDLVIIEIGLDELMLSFNVSDKYKYLDGMIKSMDELINIVKRYCKEKILLVGYYSNNIGNQKYVDYINEKYYEISKKYDIKYLNIDELGNKKYFTSNNYHLNDKDYKWLNEQIIKTIY